MTKRALWYVCLGLLCLGLVAIGVNAAVTSKSALKPYNPLATHLNATGTAPAKTVALGEKTGLDFAKKGGVRSTAAAAPEAAPVTDNEPFINMGARSFDAHGRNVTSAVPTHAPMELVPVASQNLEEVAISMGAEEESSNSGRQSLDAICNFPQVAGTNLYILGSQWTTEYLRWMNPLLCTGAQPYRIDTLRFALFRGVTSTGVADTALMAFTIYCPAIPGDSCSGPGTPIWGVTTTARVTAGTANTGILYTVTLPSALKPCLSGPFYFSMGMRSWTTHATATPPNFAIYDTPVLAPCVQFALDPPACNLTTWLGGNYGTIYMAVYGQTATGCSPSLTCTYHACNNITCVGGDQIEPTEFTGSPDSTQMRNDPDGGCNSTPHHWGSLTLGTFKCGRFFTYSNPSGSHSRDTDWYLFTIPPGGSDTLHVTMYTEYPATIIISDTNCASPNIYNSWLTIDGQCTTAVTSSCLLPGTYALFVSSGSFDCPLWPSFADYRIKVAVAGECAPPPQGRCCYTYGQCVINSAAQCATLNGTWTTGITSCVTNPCPQWTCVPDFTVTPGPFPTIIRSTTVGKGVDCNIGALGVTQMGGQDLMIRVNITSPGYYQFSMCDTTSWDSKIALTTECCGGSVLYISDDDCGTGGGLSKICGFLDTGTYWLDIAAWGDDTNPFGSGPVHLLADTCVPCSPRPANDDCINALPVVVNDPNPTCVDVTCASVDFPCDAFGAASVWFYFDLPPNPPDNCYNLKMWMCGSDATVSTYYGILVKDSCCSPNIQNRSGALTGACADGWFATVFDSVTPGRWYFPAGQVPSTGTCCRRITARACAPCATCPPGAINEGETDCSDTYVDNFNGGCNSSPPVFSSIQCGQTVCGKSGTFNGDANRDLDWYQFTLTTRSYVTWSAVANFDPQLFVVNTADCNNPVIMVSDTGITCDTLSVTTALLNPGTYSGVIGPKFSGGHVDCGTTYTAWLTCTPCAGVDTTHRDVRECAEVPDSTNADLDCTGGCNNDPFPHLYGTISCGQTAVGQSFTYITTGGGTGRDTDWWHLSLAAATSVRFSLEAEFPARILVISPYEDCANSPVVGNLDAKEPCMTHTLTMSLAAGDYTVFVGPRSLGNLNVPYPRYYRLTIGCPCVDAKQATAYLNATLDGVVVHWYAPVSEPYQIWRTTDYNAVYPSTFTQVATVSATAGVNAWTDPDEPLNDGYARYVVVHQCP